jgi:hypothetical protein
MIPALSSSQDTLSATGPKLVYYGGRILENPNFVSLYAGSYWNTAKGRTERTQLTQCSQSIPTGTHATVWKEYGSAPGTFSGSKVIPLTASQKIISEQEIQSLVAQAIRSRGVVKPDGQTVYTVFLPPKTVLQHGTTDSRNELGGFHGSYVDPSTRKPVYYAAIAYADQGNGIPFTKNPIDNMTIAASHEWAEAVTDPDVNRGKLAWYDKRFGEIGDIPISVGFPLSSLWGRLKGCAVQKEWSNSRQAPVLEVR